MAISGISRARPSAGRRRTAWLGYAKPGDFFSRANGVSRDGKTIVGVSGPEYPDAFVWTEAHGMKALPQLPNPTYYSATARAVNANGTVVVGSASSSLGKTHAVRWTAQGIEDLVLNTYPNQHSSTFAVSDDGSIVGGSVQMGAQGLGFLWTEGLGLVSAADYLALHGVLVPSNLLLMQVYAISGDGLTFGGLAYDINAGQSQGFVATVPAPGALLAFLLPMVMAARRRARG
jgi:probable HAF family extracellular repeat protein